MTEYFAKIKKRFGGRYLVEFLDLEGCFTEGDSLTKALRNAKEALDGYLASRCDRNLDFLPPKKYRGKHFYPIAVDLRIAFAIDLRRLRVQKDLTQTDIAKKLGVTQQAYAKLETPRCNPSLDTIKRLSEALDAEVDLRLIA